MKAFVIMDNSEILVLMSSAVLRAMWLAKVWIAMGVGGDSRERDIRKAPLRLPYNNLTATKGNPKRNFR